MHFVGYSSAYFEGGCISVYIPRLDIKFQGMTDQTKCYVTNDMHDVRA